MSEAMQWFTHVVELIFIWFLWDDYLKRRP